MGWPQDLAIQPSVLNELFDDSNKDSNGETNLDWVLNWYARNFGDDQSQPDPADIPYRLGDLAWALVERGIQGVDSNGGRKDLEMKDIRDWQLLLRWWFKDRQRRSQRQKLEKTIHETLYPGGQQRGKGLAFSIEENDKWLEPEYGSEDEPSQHIKITTPRREKDPRPKS